MTPTSTIYNVDFYRWIKILSERSKKFSLKLFFKKDFYIK